MSKDDEATVVSNVVTGALFDFVGYLCSTPDFWSKTLNIRDELTKWAEMRGLNLTEADVLNWEKHVRRED